VAPGDVGAGTDVTSEERLVLGSEWVVPPAEEGVVDTVEDIVLIVTSPVRGMVLLLLLGKLDEDLFVALVGGLPELVDGVPGTASTLDVAKVVLVDAEPGSVVGLELEGGVPNEPPAVEDETPGPDVVVGRSVTSLVVVAEFEAELPGIGDPITVDESFGVDALDEPLLMLDVSVVCVIPVASTEDVLDPNGTELVVEELAEIVEELFVAGGLEEKE
jgi:hypothetical protein